MPNHRMRATLALLLALLLLSLAAVPAFGQIGNPAGMNPGLAQSEPGMPAPGQTNTTDRLFTRLVGMGNAGEVELGKLADARASHPGVKAFARRMVHEHSGTAGKLADLAKQNNIALPAEPEPDQQAARAQLEGLRGDRFDAAYLQAQLIDHQKTVQLLQWEISFGQEPRLQRLAMETLPVVLDHLQQVQALIAETRGTPPQGLAAAGAAVLAAQR
jgi:putative membrane protein